MYCRSNDMYNKRFVTYKTQEGIVLSLHEGIFFFFVLTYEGIVSLAYLIRSISIIST